jgi:hypothetical protein
MKSVKHFIPGNFIHFFRITSILLLIVSGFKMTQGQVNLTQTLDADFNKGVLNNLVVGSNNVYLQFAASGVGTWTSTAVLPQTLAGHKTATGNNKYVYLVGGFNGSSYSNAVYLATIQTAGISAWTTLNPLPVALRDPAVVVATNAIYVMGGRNALQLFNTIYYATINADGTIGSWQTSSVTLPDSLWGHTAVYLNGSVYIAGGSDLLDENAAISNVYFTRLKTDHSLNEFETATALPDERNRHCMVTYNNSIYVLGGYDSLGIKKSTVYSAVPAMNGPLDTWSEATSMPVALSNHTAVINNGLIIVMAGATASSYSNTVYYANIDQVLPWTWNASPNLMYDLTRDGAAFQGNGQVIYCGGVSLANAYLSTNRYANLSLTSNYVNHGVFVSYPFYELGAERLINSLVYTATFNATFANCQVSYRTAGSDKIWGDWTALASPSPIAVNQTKQYLQYAVFFNGQLTYNSTLSDMTMITPGTSLDGNLNAITAFTPAGSPYWVFSDISFTAGTHTFQAGTTVLFSPNTGMTVSQANIICNGTVTDSVKFYNLGLESGKWNGIYFDPNSDNAVSSQLYYTVVANAGNGGNNANIYCNSSNEPLMVNCYLRNADGIGLRLISSSPSLQNTVIKGNTEHGVYLDLSHPVFVNTAISYNGNAGVYYNNISSIPTYSNTTIDHNLYGLYYTTPNYSFAPPAGLPTLTANTYNGITMLGGDITTTDKTWYQLPYDYFVLGTIRIIQASSKVRLTIKPGNSIKLASGAQIQIGTASYGGELFAIGKADSMITFTSMNGQAGGWNGIYFTDNSDNWGGHSKLEYCIIEKATDYNYYSEYSVQPDTVRNCIIRNALTDGARYANNATPGVIRNSQFLNNGRYPLNLTIQEADPSHTGNVFSGNVINKIAIFGGNYTTNRTLVNDDAVPYYVLNDIYVIKSASYSVLTIQPGVTVEFATGKKLQVGQASYGGVLVAQGTAASPIVFKAYTDVAGGWAGIYFQDASDNYGGNSIMSYCTVKQGSSYNLSCEYTAKPSLDHCIFTQSNSIGLNLNNTTLNLDSCTVSNSASHGIVATNASGYIHGCQFLNNNGYPLKYNDYTCNYHLKGNIYSGNLLQYIALSGGDYYQDRTIYYDGIPYHVLANIRILKASSHSRITVQPGVTLAFNPATWLQVGVDGNYGGDLYAEGRADSLITFTAYNDLVGGWGGIFFNQFSDDFGSTSSLKYCKIEKGSSYNIHCNSTNQPILRNCQVLQSAATGINLYSSSISIDSCQINNSGTFGLYMNYYSSPSVRNNQFFNNGSYPVKLDAWTCQPYLHNNTYTGNGMQYICYPGGDISENRSLYFDGIPYHVLADIRILKQNTNARLTIKPGVTLAFEPAKRLQVGYYNSGATYGGELYAEGKADSMITFKPFNNTVGGWVGIHFESRNDDFGGTSKFQYCKVEKAASWNLLVEGSNQPANIKHCEFTQSADIGIYLSNSSMNIDSNIISNSGSQGMFLNTGCSPTVRYNQFLDNNSYPIKFNSWYNNPYLSGNTYSGNTLQYIAHAGGDISENRTLYNDGIPYHVLTDIRILKQNTNARLTIKPGVTLAFEPAKRLQVGYYNAGATYGGELYAEGKADSIITFKPYNDAIGGWVGIHFESRNDDFGGISKFQYCKVEKAASWNLLIEGSNQPAAIKHCEFTQSADMGIYLTNSSMNIDSNIISNSGSQGMFLNSGCSPNVRFNQFLNNNSYPIKFNSWYNNPYLFSNTYSGNTLQYISYPGGDLTENRTLFNDGIPYHVLTDIKIMKPNSYARLTIKPGATLAFEPGKNLQIGYYNAGATYGGELYSEGTADSMITFKPYNNAIGGWGIVYFDPRNDDYGGTSSLKYCRIEKGSPCNIQINGSTQPVIDHCIITQSAGNGMNLISLNNLTIRNSSFTYNAGNGVQFDGSGTFTIGNDTAFTNSIYYNTGYNIYNNTASNINAKYNYWGTRDSVSIASKIYDKSDNSAKGIVYFMPFATVPVIPGDAMQLNGYINYANSSSSPMYDATVAIKKFNDTTVATTTTDDQGSFSIDLVPSGGYRMVVTPADEWGGVNSTDALHILNHTTFISPLTGLKLKAADVNQSFYVNATDALYTMQRFVGMITSFPSGDFLIANDTIIINGQEVSNDLSVLNFGDVNASFIPGGAKSSPGLELVYSDPLRISPFTLFDLPVSVQPGILVGAISFGLYYPEAYLEILGVEMADGNPCEFYSTANGLLRIAWSSIAPIKTMENEPFLVIKMKSKDLTMLSREIRPELYEFSELADPSGGAIQGAVVNMPSIVMFTNSLGEIDRDLAISVHPNPFRDMTTLDFYIPEPARMKITLHNIFGDVVHEIADAVYPSGQHRVSINLPGLSPGIYLLKMTKACQGRTSVKMVKVVVSR